MPNSHLIHAKKSVKTNWKKEISWHISLVCWINNRNYRGVSFESHQTQIPLSFPQSIRENCYYHGLVNSEVSTWAAISTCFGIRWAADIFYLHFGASCVILWECGLCEYVIVHMILGGSPVILWISLGGKPKWLPLKFGYHDVMRTGPIAV